MNNTDILEEDVKNILNCCTDIETLISLDERAKEDLKNNTHNIQQQEVLTIIREFIRCKNDCSNLIAENKELKEFKENIERIDKKQLDKLYKDAQKALKEYRETQNKVAKLEEENKELKEENEGLKTKLDTLIEKYKELKEEKEELKRENLEIRDWKYVIDSPIDLDKLKELDLIKIKGKEYISKSIYNELEKDKKALINNYSKILGEFIPKSKVEGLIEELDIEIQCCTYADDDVEEYKQDIEKEKARLLRDKKTLQSLLGKE